MGRYSINVHNERTDPEQKGSERSKWEQAGRWYRKGREGRNEDEEWRCVKISVVSRWSTVTEEGRMPVRSL